MQRTLFESEKNEIGTKQCCSENHKCRKTKGETDLVGCFSSFSSTNRLIWKKTNPSFEFNFLNSLCRGRQQHSLEFAFPFQDLTGQRVTNPKHNSLLGSSSKVQPKNSAVFPIFCPLKKCSILDKRLELDPEPILRTPTSWRLCRVGASHADSGADAIYWLDWVFQNEYSLILAFKLWLLPFAFSAKTVFFMSAFVSVNFRACGVILTKVCTLNFLRIRKCCILDVLSSMQINSHNTAEFLSLLNSKKQKTNFSLQQKETNSLKACFCNVSTQFHKQRKKEQGT